MSEADRPEERCGCGRRGHQGPRAFCCRGPRAHNVDHPMAYIDEPSPSFEAERLCGAGDEEGACSWQAPDLAPRPAHASLHNGAISKNNINYSQYNGVRKVRDNPRDRSNADKSDRGSSRSINRSGSEEKTRSPKHTQIQVVSMTLNNVNINGVQKSPRKKLKSRESSTENDTSINGSYKSGSKISDSANSLSYSEVSPTRVKVSGAGQGSPLRSQLALKLKPNTPKKSLPSPTLQCLMCEFKASCPKKLEEHINRAHFDLTSPSVVGTANLTTGTGTTRLNTTSHLDNATSSVCRLDNRPHGEEGREGRGAGAEGARPSSSTFSCPLCEASFSTGSQIELHVNVDHKDILSPHNQDDDEGCGSDERMREGSEDGESAGASAREGGSPPDTCPVCLQPMAHYSREQLMEHIEEHFSNGERTPELTARRDREEHDFHMLKAAYGMEEGVKAEGYSSREGSGLRRAVYSGELSVASYYERATKDTGISATSGLLERIASLNSENSSIERTYLCSAVEHYASTQADRGWGCGYRNMQMVVSGMLCEEELGGRVAARWERSVPSIPRLQLMLEHAWQMGFDTQGCEQLGGKVHNTRKWIGACEFVTLLSSMRIKCELVDFHTATGRDGEHPLLFEWVLSYFTSEPHKFKPPLYLQHQGHSRTIIGYERYRDGRGVLLVLDPSHAPAQVRQVLGPDGRAALKLLRRGVASLRARQYQLVAVTGLIQTDLELEEAKVLHSVRIPQDR